MCRLLLLIHVVSTAHSGLPQGALMQVLQIVAVDVPTHSHLGVCLAVRVSEAVALLNSHTIPSEGSDCERAKYLSYEIEHTILLHHMGKKCKQRFLKADRKDS